MPIRLAYAHCAPALLFAGLVFLPLFAASKSMAGDDKPCTKECDASPQQKLQVRLEVRLIAADEAFAQNVRIGNKDSMVCEPADPSDASLHVTYLDDAQASHLLEAARKDSHTNVGQATKTTVCSNQSWVYDDTKPESFVTHITLSATSSGNPLIVPEIDELPIGMRMTARPVVSADRHFVQVNLNVNLSALRNPKADVVPIALPPQPPGEDGEPGPTMQLIQIPRVTRLALDGAFNIPEGGSALISGWKIDRDEQTEIGPAVLGKFPFLSNLSKIVCYSHEKQRVMLLVTPRIVVNEEKEEKVTGKVEQATCPCEGAAERSVAPAHFKQAEVADLMAKYYRACAEGRTADATQLAVQALAMDPTCFHGAEASAAADR